MTEDPFAAPTDLHMPERKLLITGGRYRLPYRDGSHKPGGWMRVSNLVSAISDQKALQDWEVRMILQGISSRPDLYAALVALVGRSDLTGQDYRNAIKDLAREAKEAAGGGEGARWGTERHAEVEALHAGVPYVYSGPAWRRLQAYQHEMEANGLQAEDGMQERRVLVESLEVCGTLDNILRDLARDVLLVGDLKTQKRFWTWLEIEAQLAIYAHGDAMWDTATESWVDMPAVSRDEAVVMWMPRERPDVPGLPIVEIRGVDIARGWDTAQQCFRAIQRRREAKTARENRSGWLWMSPPMAIQVERYARRFAAVATVAEGSALVAEAKRAGVWGPELQSAALKAANRISPVRA